MVAFYFCHHFTPSEAITPLGRTGLKRVKQNEKTFVTRNRKRTMKEKKSQEDNMGTDVEFIF